MRKKPIPYPKNPVSKSESRIKAFKARCKVVAALNNELFAKGNTVKAKPAKKISVKKAKPAAAENKPGNKSQNPE
jgi:hypothetical protein